MPCNQNYTWVIILVTMWWFSKVVWRKNTLLQKTKKKERVLYYINKNKVFLMAKKERRGQSLWLTPLGVIIKTLSLTLENIGLSHNYHGQGDHKPHPSPTRELKAWASCRQKSHSLHIGNQTWNLLLLCSRWDH